MSLPAQTIRTILAAVVLCLCATQVKPQQSGESANSTIRGVVVYADTGHPLRRAHVRVASIQGEGEMDTVSDLRGRFVLENVPAGKFTVVAYAPGILKSDDARVGTTEVVVNGTDSVEVKVRAVRGGVITGRVLTDDDQPVVNADVKLLRREAGKWVPVGHTWDPHREENIGLKTDASGVYRIAGLPSGEYAVRASEPSLPGDGVPGDDDAYTDGSFMVAYHPAVTVLKDAQAISVTLGSESTGIDIRMTERAS
ncbi:MAG TPA: carboxypeptidase-like regulatory domain-containing protein, partial [Pyrinomonadaceae bacterium]|nr:carboxypeptidase-like regulatory domain-containing protein [Pyrinomonadaceae bacterium]